MIGGAAAGMSLSGVPFASQLPGYFDLSNTVSLTLSGCPGIALSSSPHPTPGQSFVSFTNPREEYATLQVYDLSERMVERWLNQMTQAGQQYRLEFNSVGLPNGVYMYRLTSDSGVIIKKFIIAKYDLIFALKIHNTKGGSLIRTVHIFMHD